jgi:glyoxylase-like metal-dependent hydrolase (beta-lactamase superfamily II)
VSSIRPTSTASGIRAFPASSRNSSRWPRRWKSIDLVVAGDVAYNGVHPYMAEGNPQSWAKWIAALEKLELLKPRAVIAGHKRPENDDDPRIIEETRTYFRDFLRLNEETTTVREFFDRMMKLHGDRANPGSLWGG